MNRTKISRIVFYLVLILTVGFSTYNCGAQTTPNERRNKSINSCFNEDGFLKVNGKARLIIGLYELPKDDEKLQEVAESGFNLVRSPQDIEALDRIGKYNLHA